MSFCKVTPLVASAALCLLSYQTSNAQSTSCSAALPKFAAAMKAGTSEALSTYLEQHGPCFEAPAKAKLKALGGTPPAAEANKNDAEKPAVAANEKPKEKNLENEILVDDSCKKFANARSERSDESLPLKIINRTDETLSVSWINYEGERQPPSDLLPGKSYGGKTFVTHPFEVTRSDKTCIKIVMPKVGVSEYFIDK